MNSRLLLDLVLGVALAAGGVTAAWVAVRHRALARKRQRDRARAKRVRFMRDEATGHALCLAPFEQGKGATLVGRGEPETTIDLYGLLGTQKGTADDDGD